MTKTMLFVVIISIVGLTIAQQPVPCTSPSQWEARLYSINEQSKMVVTGKLSYDSVYQRVRILEDIKIGPDDNYYTIIRLFQLKLEFSLNMKTNNCTRQPLERPWRDIGLFPDSQSHGEAYVGSSAIPGGGLLVSLWSGNETFSQNRTITYMQAWTYQGCLPVADTSVDPKFGMSHSSFYDVIGGITDPDVFIPPRQCLTAEEYRGRHELFGPVTMKKMR